MTDERLQKMIRRSRNVFAVIGILFLALAAWAFVDPSGFPDHASWSTGLIGLVLLVGARFAPDKIVLLFTGPLP